MILKFDAVCFPFLKKESKNLLTYLPLNKTFNFSFLTNLDRSSDDDYHGNIVMVFYFSFPRTF